MSLSVVSTGINTTASSVASLAVSISVTSASGHNIYVFVSLAGASTVTGISDTHNTYTLVAAKSGTGIRTELWHSPGYSTGGSLTVTVSVSPNTSLSAVVAQISGVTGEGLSVTASGNDAGPRVGVTTTGTGNYVIGGLGFVTGASTTFSLPSPAVNINNDASASAQGIQAAYNTQTIGDALLTNLIQLNAAQQWAAVGMEILSGGTAETYDGYSNGGSPVPSMSGAGSPVVKDIPTFSAPPATSNYGYTS